jgi:uncharacterized protein
MPDMNRYRLILFLLTLALVIPVQAQQLPEPMVPLRLVNDFTGLLNEQDQFTLNNKLLAFNNETSTQIYVITYDDLQGFDIADFGDRLGEKWGIGQEGKNNGLLVLISPAEHKVTIRTGYGLEGAVPDAIAFRLISSVITPGFKQGNYYASLDSATNVIMSLTRGEFTSEDYLKKNEIPSGIFPLLFFLFIFIFIIVSNVRRRNYYSPKHSLPWWILLGTGGARNSGWEDFSSGGGNFGGFGGGGGGFGGGGGGSFGGGGASGGW